jgi:hypothetical protein
MTEALRQVKAICLAINSDDAIAQRSTLPFGKTNAITKVAPVAADSLQRI